MAKGKNKERTPEPPEPAEAEEPNEEAASEVPEEEAALATRDPADVEPSAVAEGDTEGAEAEEETSAADLGSERYVLAAFFASGMLLAYIAGLLIHTLWATLANEDWFSRALPAIAGVGDDEKTTIGLVLGGIIALVVVLRLFRNPEIRTWADEVAAELAKVKWPTKKEVTNSTFVVITATTVATLYLALLDRFWGFVTNLVYGDGS